MTGAHTIRSALGPGVASQKNTLYSHHPGVYICNLYPRLRKKPKPQLI